MMIGAEIKAFPVALRLERLGGRIEKGDSLQGGPHTVNQRLFVRHRR